MRLSLEVVDDMVEMVLTAHDGQRRILSTSEQELIRRWPTIRLSALLEDGCGDQHEDFVDELVSAGVLVGHS